MAERLGMDPERNMAVESTGEPLTPVLCPKRSELRIGSFVCTVQDCGVQAVNDAGNSSFEGDCAIDEALAPSTTGDYRRISDILARFPDRTA